jgi:hypothetical protein
MKVRAILSFQGYDRNRIMYIQTRHTNAKRALETLRKAAWRAAGLTVNCLRQADFDIVCDVCPPERRTRECSGVKCHTCVHGKARGSTVYYRWTPTLFKLGGAL